MPGRPLSTISSEPLRTISAISRSEPSSLLLKTCTAIRPFDFCSTRRLNSSVATGMLWVAG